MPDLTLSTTVDAPRSEVWAVLADLEAVQDYAPGIAAARLTSNAPTGVGAARVCDLTPMGRLDETVTGWDEGRTLDVDIRPSGLPIPPAHATFRLDEDADGRTTVTMEYAFTGGGLAGRLARPALRRGLRSGLQGMLDGLRDHVEARRAAAT